MHLQLISMIDPHSWCSGIFLRSPGASNLDMISRIKGRPYQASGSFPFVVAKAIYLPGLHIMSCGTGETCGNTHHQAFCNTQPYYTFRGMWIMPHSELSLTNVCTKSVHWWLHCQSRSHNTSFQYSVVWCLTKVLLNGKLSTYWPAFYLTAVNEVNLLIIISVCQSVINFCINKLNGSSWICVMSETFWSVSSSSVLLLLCGKGSAADIYTYISVGEGIKTALSPKIFRSWFKWAKF